MSFQEKIKTAQRLTLQAAFELLHWDNDDAPQELSQCLMANANIHISGVPKSGKSHVGFIVRALPNYTITDVLLEFGNYVKLDGGSDFNNGEPVEFRLKAAVTNKDMEVFWRCISAMRSLLSAQEHHEQ